MAADKKEMKVLITGGFGTFTTNVMDSVEKRQRVSETALAKAQIELGYDMVQKEIAQWFVSGSSEQAGMEK